MTSKYEFRECEGTLMLLYSRILETKFNVLAVHWFMTTERTPQILSKAPLGKWKIISRPLSYKLMIFHQ
jgi:hypothetical protein